MFFSTTNSCFNSNHLYCEKKVNIVISKKLGAANVIPCRIAIHSTYDNTLLNSTKHS